VKNADQETFLRGAPGYRAAVAASLAKSRQGRSFLADVARDRSTSIDLRAAADNALQDSVEIELLRSVVVAFLALDEHPELQWRGVQRCVKVGLFDFSPVVRRLRESKERVGWLSSTSLGGLVERALALLEARRTDPAFGDDLP
jgi:hypothetical protein